MKPIDDAVPDLQKFLDELHATAWLQVHSDLSTQRQPKDTGDFIALGRLKAVIARMSRKSNKLPVQ